jgi:hypothetical protein
LVTPRRGASSIGCLFSLLIVAVIIYFGVNIGEVYWRYYQYEDDMRQQVRFASHKTNEAISSELRAQADSLSLPEAAGEVTIRRSQSMISVESEYYETVELPLYARDLLFHPHAEGPL